ncbi:unnamed protein product [Amaranthus hypochondriacus]
MNPRVRTHILSSGAKTFQGAYETALSIHASILEEEGSKQGSGSRQGVGPKKCWGCGKEVHPGKICDGSRVVCYYCKEEGHKTYQCPKKGGATNTGAASLQCSMINCMTQQEADTHPDVVSGTFLLNNVYAYVLFDTGATMSFISSSFVSVIGLSARYVVKSLVTLPSGEEYPCNREFRDIPIVISGCELRANLKEFPMIEFDVILGMDWLSEHYATFHCRDQKIVLKGPKGRRISYSGVIAKKGVKLPQCSPDSSSVAQQGSLRVHGISADKIVNAVNPDNSADSEVGQLSLCTKKHNNNEVGVLSLGTEHLYNHDTGALVVGIEGRADE